MKRLPIYSFQLITSLLLAISLFGFFERNSSQFITSISEKNIIFLAIITEIKLAFTSIGTEKIPFISGEAETVNNSLNKAENYLLITNVISLIQLLFLSICKSWTIKIIMILLWLFTFIKRFQYLNKKILVLALAINPGLSIYAVVVKQITQESSIDFGEQYLHQLKAKVVAIKTEKSNLIKEHQQANQQIDKEGEQATWRHLKDDLAYDLKKTDLSIKGSYANIRMLIHEAGHSLLKNIVIFCTMILFSLFIMPLGYCFLIYILYNSLFVVSGRLSSPFEQQFSNKEEELDESENAARGWKKNDNMRINFP